jgi:hypothetical protein
MRLRFSQYPTLQRLRDGLVLLAARLVLALRGIGA